MGTSVLASAQPKQSQVIAAAYHGSLQVQAPILDTAFCATHVIAPHCHTLLQRISELFAMYCLHNTLAVRGTHG